MGWEFDGGEDEFNTFCNQNSSNEINYDYDPGYELINSIFYNKLKCVEYLEESDFNVLYFEKYKQSLNNIQSFLKDTNLQLNYDSYGNIIEYIDNYESAIENQNPILYSKRTNLKNIRKLLFETYNIKELNSLVNRKSDILEGYKNANLEWEEIDESYIIDILSGRVISEYFDFSNILIRLMNIATLHLLHVSSNGDLYFDNYILPDYSSEIFLDSFQTEKDIPFIDNPFWYIIDKEEYYEGMPKLLQKLGKVFDLIIKLKKNHSNDLSNINYNFEKSFKKISLQSDVYVLTIEESIGLLDKIKYDITLCIDKYGELNQIFSFSSDENLKPLNYNLEELYKYQKESRKSKKNNLVIDDLINIGYNLVNEETFFWYEEDKFLLNENRLYKKDSILELDYYVNHSNLILEVGSIVYVNCFQYTIINDKYELDGLINENGADLIIDAYKNFGVEYEDGIFNNQRTYNISIKFGSLNLNSFYLQDLHLFNDVITSLNNYIPSSESNNYFKDDYLVIFNFFAEIKMDCIGYYYIKPLNERTFITFFEFFNLNKYTYVKDILGYYIDSNYIVCHSLDDINKIITQIQKKIDYYSNNKLNFLQVGDKIKLGDLDFSVKYNDENWSTSRKKKKKYSLDYFNSKCNENFVIDSDKCYINIESFTLNVIKIKDSIKNCEDLFQSNTLEDLTLIVNLFNSEIENQKHNNDIVIEQNRVFKIAGNTLKYSRSNDGKWFIYYVKETFLFSYSKSILLKEVFDFFSGGIEALSNQILGYYFGDENKIFFNNESDLILFIIEAQNEYFKSRETIIDLKVPNSLKIVALDDEIICNKLKCIVANNKNGYYLKSTDNFSQYKLCENLKYNMESYFETSMGYYDGGVFPYCRSLFHLSYFIYCLNEIEVE